MGIYKLDYLLYLLPFCLLLFTNRWLHGPHEEMRGVVSNTAVRLVFQSQTSDSGGLRDRMFLTSELIVDRRRMDGW